MTFKQAQDKIFESLRQRGWYHSAPTLIVRWARPAGTLDQSVKVWFKPQALHKGQDRPTSSLWVDPREIAVKSPQEIETLILNLIGD